MNNSSEARLIYLFGRYYNKIATAEEMGELFHLLNGEVNDKQLSDLLSKAWDDLQVKDPLFTLSKSKEILGRILLSEIAEEPAMSIIPERGKLLLFKKIAVAAAVLLFISFTVYLFIDKHQATKQKLVKKEIKHDAFPGGNKAVLTLANGATIVLDSARNGVLAKSGNTEVTKTNNGQLVYKVKSAVGNSNDVALNLISTPRGGQYQIVLVDGTKVWLNASSSLRFPIAFTGRERRVEITGEAYFEVAKNPAMPFLIKTKSTEVRVLGTHFNIMAYDDEREMKTTLLEGTVKLTNGNVSGILTPGQQAVIDKNGKLRIHDGVNISQQIAWKMGLFQFKAAGIEEIMRQASRWYDLDVSYEGKIPVKEFTGKISRNINASELLNMLKYTGVNFRIEGKRILVSN